MKILVLRHANAENYAPTDSERELSEKGRYQLDNQIQEHSAIFSSASHVFVSPYVRAQQTWAHLQSHIVALDLLDAVTTTQVTPSGSVQGVIALLESLPQDATVLLVSHQPLVGMLIDDLCGLETGCYRMGTAALASLDADSVAKGLATLNWIKHPVTT